MTNKDAHEDHSCSVDITVSTPQSSSIEDDSSKAEKDKDQQDLSKASEIVSKNISPTEGDNHETNSKFKGFGFSAQLLKTLADKGYKEPSPIQKATFPELMLGHDLVGQAQTGTGKTAAFALPLLERMQQGSGLPQALVLAPTRELAMQVADSFRAYAAGHPHLKILAVYGGSDFRSQINALKRGIDVVVGTPGRVMDHMRQGTLNTSGLKSLVLDEADEMLRMGFIDDVEWILEQLPANRQMVLFSATMPSEIRRLSKKYLNNPAEITIKSREKEASLIRQRFIIIQNSNKLEGLNRVLEAVTGKGVIIFVRTKAITLTVAESLEANGHDVAVLNGDVPQSQRERTVERLRNGGINVLVATDVAARGLDVDRIALVINYDMPFDSEAYVHRIGRTGRAGRNGEAILFVNPRERRFITGIERAIGRPIEPMEIPNNETINQCRMDRLRERLKDSAEKERDDPEESKLLKELLKNLKNELDVTSEQIAFAALNLVVGPSSMLMNADEKWVQKSKQNSRHDARREDHGYSKRRPDRSARSPEDHMERFRVEVGHRDRVKPGNLVGAIANESGLKGRMIGRIQIFESHSLIDLPKGMPEAVFKDLKRVKVMNRELQIQRA